MINRKVQQRNKTIKRTIWIIILLILAFVTAHVGLSQIENYVCDHSSIDKAQEYGCN